VEGYSQIRQEWFSVPRSACYEFFRLLVSNDPTLGNISLITLADRYDRDENDLDELLDLPTSSLRDTIDDIQ